MKSIFDCIVIGRGLIGSAAARYLKQSLDKVLIIGPDEPTDPHKAEVFASHYDQARVQRIVGITDTWTRLNKDSTDQYPSLQQESGINFHFPVGCLYVSPFQKDAYLTNAPSHLAMANTSASFLESADAIHKKIPEFSFPHGSCGMLEHAPSGHINPLLLKQAQLTVYKNHGGDASGDTVVKVDRHHDVFTVNTQEGTTYYAHQLLVTAGAFSNFNGLLPQPLDLELESETVLLAEVSLREAQRLSSLPSLLYELETDELEGVYLVRPVQYPDGKYYLKLGCNLPTDITFGNLNEIQQWFRHGNSEVNIPVLRKALHTLMPNLETIGFKTKKCIISRTKHRHAYIGSTDQKNLFVAAGGNGYSAMCSDALGRIAAHRVMHEGFPEGYSMAVFQPIFAS